MIARILIDLGIIPGENTFGVFITVWSDTLAAPVQGLGSGFGGFFGGSPIGGAPFGVPGVPGIPGLPGDQLGASGNAGFSAVMVAALAGWTVVEWLVMRFVNKLQQV